MQQSTIDFICGLSRSILLGLGEANKHGISNEVAEGIEKSRNKLFTIGISVSLAGTGFFLIMWGIASAVDSIFAMRGFGFVIMGIFVIMIGALLYKK